MSIDRQTIELILSAPEITIEVGDHGNIPLIPKSDKYNGDYEVTPSRKNQILETANKVMAKNITVFEIPYSSTSNLAGGETFYIAKTVETPEENDDISRYALGTGLLDSIVLQGKSLDDTSRYSLGNGILNQIILQ